jgi:hypothetical protein
MVTSAALTWAIIAVAVVCLAAWLILVRFADDHPRHRHARQPQWQGPVLGGMHTDGGRSVAPNRDLPAHFTEAELQEMSRRPAPGQPTTPRPAVPGQPLPARPAAPSQPVPAQPAPSGGGASVRPAPSRGGASVRPAATPDVRLPEPREAGHDQPAKDRPER